MANLTLWGIINGIARDARTAKDTNAMSLCEEIAQRAEFVFGTTYDGSTSFTTTYYITGPGQAYPPAGNAPSWDAALNLGLTNIKQIGA